MSIQEKMDKIAKLLEKSKLKASFEKYSEDSYSVDYNTGNGDDLFKYGFEDGEIICARESILIIKELEKKLGLARYTLEFYAKPDNYSSRPHVDSRIDEDFGELARKALEQIKEGE